MIQLYLEMKTHFLSGASILDENGVIVDLMGNFVEKDLLRSSDQTWEKNSGRKLLTAGGGNYQLFVRVNTTNQSPGHRWNYEDRQRSNSNNRRSSFPFSPRLLWRTRNKTISIIESSKENLTLFRFGFFRWFHSFLLLVFVVALFRLDRLLHMRMSVSRTCKDRSATESDEKNYSHLSDVGRISRRWERERFPRECKDRLECHWSDCVPGQLNENENVSVRVHLDFHRRRWHEESNEEKHHRVNHRRQSSGELSTGIDAEDCWSPE